MEPQIPVQFFPATRRAHQRRDPWRHRFVSRKPSCLLTRLPIEKQFLVSGLTNRRQVFVAGGPRNAHRFEEKRRRTDQDQRGDQKFSEHECAASGKSK